MADLTDAQKLAEAETALHRFKTGNLVSEIEVDGRRVKNNKTDLDKLEGYVNELRARVAGQCLRHGGIGFFF